LDQKCDNLAIFGIRKFSGKRQGDSMGAAPRYPRLGLLGWFVLCFAVAWVGSSITTPEIGSWYAGLAKPSWTPPNGVFGPVWSILYLCMAVSAWLVWRQNGFRGSANPWTAFGIQLVLNVGWSLCFFGLHKPGVAFLDIVLLWLAILMTIVLFWRRSTPAGILLLPYLLWVSFASVLNYAIWRMNG
jgi:tryptophan-rich sensory protein